MRRINLGKVLYTKGISESISKKDVQKALQRHSKGDWGDICEDDKKDNEYALRDGCRLVSSYMSKNNKCYYLKNIERKYFL